MRTILKELRKAMWDVTRYIVLPTLAVVVLIISFDVTLMGLSSLATASFFGFMSILYGVFKYDTIAQIEAESENARRKALIIEKAELLRKQAEEKRQSELRQKWWDENFATVCSWSDEVGRRYK